MVEDIDRGNKNILHWDMKTNANQIKDLTFLTEKRGKQNWILDSGSTSHISNNQELFSKINNNENSTVIIDNGKK